ncbi:MAG: SOS response-associated peptidase [Pseudomonadota bacterium]
MCGRYVLRTSTPELAAILGAEPSPAAPPPGDGPRFNIAPTVMVPAARLNDTGNLELAGLSWGLVPFWSKDRKGAAKMINARGETVATKPAFRAAFKRRRCLIPADGYYEWKRLDDHKQPFFIQHRAERVLWFAGLWESWRDADDSVLQTCSIVTIDASADVAGIHHRMPVILHPETYDTWLRGTADAANDLVQIPPTGLLRNSPVSTFVNNSRNDGERCITPLADP